MKSTLYSVLRWMKEYGKEGKRQTQEEQKKETVREKVCVRAHGYTRVHVCERLHVCLFATATQNPTWQMHPLLIKLEPCSHAPHQRHDRSTCHRVRALLSRFPGCLASICTRRDSTSPAPQRQPGGGSHYLQTTTQPHDGWPSLPSNAQTHYPSSTPRPKRKEMLF